MHKTMTLSTDEFMRRFLLHVLPTGFHRIRHYGLFANGGRKDNLAKARSLLHVAPATNKQAPIGRCIGGARTIDVRLPHCGAPMIVIDVLLRIHSGRAPARHQGAPP
ncbi:MAG: putative transposase [Massilia sp.]|nr:putative transposase [Massilia sp.]